MQMEHFKTLVVSQQSGVLSITLNRPEIANTMNLLMVEELNHTMELALKSKSRVVVFKGAAGNFCAGGDIKDMQLIANDAKALTKLNRAFGLMIEKANTLPCVVITVLQGAVLGGGFGLACVSDVAIADVSAKFAMPETSLGIIPAQIAPFVVARIGLTAARRLALLGLRIKADEALSLGLIHQIAIDEADLQEQLDKTIKLALNCAPQATILTKSLLHQVAEIPMSELLDRAAQDFALSVAGEGREGATAFAQKRKPNWHHR